MRAFAAFLAIIVLAGVIGAALSYPAFELVTALGRRAFHAAPAFHRVASRIAEVVLALEVVWLCRVLNVRTRQDVGYGLPWRRFLAQNALWCLIGIATAGAGAAFLLASRLRLPAPTFVASVGSVLHLLLLGLTSGIAVALIEETVMRGVIHTAVERESGSWAAALLTAPLFAVLHFFAKVRIPPEELSWHSGFDLLARSFAPLSDFSLVLDSFLSWLAVGLILSLTRVLTGNIAVAIGLHAGWVVVLRMLQEGSVRGTSPDYAVWVGRFDGLLGYWLLPWAAAIGASLWLTRTAWVPYARGANASRR